MAAREHKVASLSLTRTMGKALSDVLNGKPSTSTVGKTAASAKDAAAVSSEFGGGTTKTATSLKRMSLPTGIRSGLPTAAALGSGGGVGAGAGVLPSAGSGRASSRSSLSTTTTNTDRLASVAEDSSIQPGGPTFKVPARGKLVRPAATAAIAASALPKFKPKTTTAAPVNQAPSPTRLGTRKRRPSNESSSAVTTATDEPSNVSPTDSTSKSDRPLSPLPKRVLKKAAPAPAAAPRSSPVPKPSPKASLKENELKSSTISTGKPESRNGSPPKKIARQSSSTTTSPASRTSLRPQLAQSTPSPTIAKAKIAAANAAARTPATSSSRAAARAAQNADHSPGNSSMGANSSMEVSMMLEGVTLDPDAPSPFIPRTRPFPRTPSSNSVLSSRSRMSKALFDPRGSILSWEDMSRSFGHTDELGTFLTNIDAPFTPGERSMSMYSDTPASSTWGSPRPSAAPYTPGMSISQMMFPPAALDVGDVSFGSDTADHADDSTVNVSGMSSFSLSLSTDTHMDVDRRSRRRASVEQKDEATRVFGAGPASPDDNQAAMLVLQMQLAGMNEVRDERDALRRALDEARTHDEEAAAERDALRAERDAVQSQLDQVEIEKNMLQDIAQEERVSRVEAEDIARSVSLRDANLRKRLKGEGVRAAAAEWASVTEALRLEVERIRGERTLLDVLSMSAKTAAAIAA